LCPQCFIFKLHKNNYYLPHNLNIIINLLNGFYFKIAGHFFI
jgi:hypothetical protein